MRIALIAHDKKKDSMIEFVLKWKPFLSKQELFSTNTTGNLIADTTSLNVQCMNSGPLGGDLEIGSLIVNQKIDLLIFFRDPLTAQPHEPDVSALIRISDVYMIPTATNINSANLLMETLSTK